MNSNVVGEVNFSDLFVGEKMVVGDLMPPGSAGVSAAQCAHYRPHQQLLSVPRGKISVTLMISADVYVDFRYLRARNQLMTHIGDSPNSLCSRWLLCYANQPVW